MSCWLALGRVRSLPWWRRSRDRVVVGDGLKGRGVGRPAACRSARMIGLIRLIRLIRDLLLVQRKDQRKTVEMGLSLRRLLPIELLQELVGLVQASHGVQGAAGIGVMLQRHLAIGVSDLGEGHPLSRIRR